MSAVTTERQGEILVIWSDNQPVNALGHDVRLGLQAGVQEAAGDDSVKAVVIACKGRTFFAGADITEFATGMKDPGLPQVVDEIEALDKPVVAAIHGTALGGGCEVALSCHYRIAVPSAKLGLPEVKLGILPGAGGTQRLPRVIGIPAALGMMTGGDPISAKKAKEAGLVDRLASEDSLLEDALAYAREVIGTSPLPRTSERKVDGDAGMFEEFKAANARKMRGYEAPYEIISVVEETWNKPYSEGVERERAAFFKLVMSVQSAALRHVFFAERAASKIDDVPKDTRLRDIKKVGVIGAGTMGGGITMNFLSAGIPVTIVEMQQEALDRGVGVIRKNYENTAAKGRITTEQVEGAMGLLTPTLSMDDLADCDLIIEAVYESMDVKKDVFGKLDKIAKPGAILASNTSYLSIDEIAAATSRPGDVLGMHFFSPANVMKLLEIVRGAKTDKDVLATVMALSKKIRKVAVVAGVCMGFIGNRMLFPRQLEAEALLMEGATPQQIDKVHVDFGMPMGPFQMADLAGTDIGWHRDPERIESIRDALCAEGRWGQKKKAGYYDYDDKRNPTPSPRVAEILEEFRKKKGAQQHEVTDEEIVERTLYPMVSEGAKILAEGIAQRASDIDIVWIYGYGWPPYRGGPMFWADTEGAKKIVAGLEKHGLEVAPLLREKAEKGEKFTS
ncbi:3-hydroxyacyl-CoA dehydrogenase NAD-binding domain-containing protein [Stakelama tenebrarum]|uniref:3-hydroxyacyl-CoA dehydrogenase n=1 Tax=Stakelama tenebrarum TaxID=2711215 RepID=A0A6G6Y6J7_9SPHN|nr:3-hydroxyacyl-CoA dehydrogenase NAD-binding domain-containing protein [Sphingosinithalassobacter tenebrarum]QIG80540.1 3-hydroxyacyl-CoA dehydrogenase [Sphingosinithalassobacter tenebrarum]